MSQRRRPTAAAVLLLLLAVVFAPALSGAGPSAAAPAGPSAFAAFAAAHAPAPPAGPAAVGRPEAAPRADPGTTGGTCRQQDVPLKGAEAAVAHGHGDPLTGPGAPRTALPQTHAPQAGPARAPPAPVAGCAELLPVLRI
ncbi:hypothetical protein LE181_25980 [Streptomyces sp. SCA3-4]|uniref:hypothetical protein n=1 Tax=Streptomyces sichuanensis TaxID=2871810 RepID=UPI001CE2B75A|nr:hypothetical protein [Streptomyces sichuanensis]MCA6095598.1 hypothetical protein [Streptomyces sichuanensis]